MTPVELSKMEQEPSTELIVKMPAKIRKHRSKILPVADPGFYPGGQIPKVLLFFTFLPKTA